MSPMSPLSRLRRQLPQGGSAYLPQFTGAAGGRAAASTFNRSTMAMER
jgi:hypothetical protein